jgi:hypothetical protein
MISDSFLNTQKVSEPRNHLDPKGDTARWRCHEFPMDRSRWALKIDRMSGRRGQKLYEHFALKEKWREENGRSTRETVAALRRLRSDCHSFCPIRDCLIHFYLHFHFETDAVAGIDAVCNVAVRQ